MFKSSGSLPSEGFCRIRDVLAVVPISRSCWWGWVSTGKAPAPVKLSPKVTAWKVADIRAFIAALENQAA